MSREHIIARSGEVQRLEQCMNETNAQLIILYGRRRIGKTFLINEFFDGRFDFKMTGVYQEKREIQLRHFADEMSAHLKREVEVPSDWIAAFRMLRVYLSELPKDEKHVVFFDELPWMDTPNGGFLPAFEHFWNDYGCSLHNLIFIICGSATSWMMKNVSENTGGLFKRQTCSIYLEPFSLKETEEYLVCRGIRWSRYDIAECYMVLGGIPFYLSLLTPEKSLSDNIDNLFFRKRAELWNEFNQLYRTLFKNSDKYIRIVEALAEKRVGLTRSEIAAKTRLPENGMLTEMLSDLVNCDFVRAYTFFGKRKAGTTYQLRDYYTWFYCKFIRDYHGRDEHFWSHTYGNPSKYAWAGLTFEQVCKDHIAQIKQKLGIAGVLAEESAWFVKNGEDHSGAQIDLLIDRQDHVINVCEIKYSLEEILIDKEYERSLRNKISAFVQTSRTKKTIQLTMITTYGVKKNMYSNMVSSQVILDDLFQ